MKVLVEVLISEVSITSCHDPISRVAANMGVSRHQAKRVVAKAVRKAAEAALQDYQLIYASATERPERDQSVVFTNVHPSLLRKQFWPRKNSEKIEELGR